MCSMWWINQSTNRFSGHFSSGSAQRSWSEATICKAGEGEAAKSRENFVIITKLQIYKNKVKAALREALRFEGFEASAGCNGQQRPRGKRSHHCRGLKGVTWHAILSILASEDVSILLVLLVLLFMILWNTSLNITWYFALSRPTKVRWSTFQHLGDCEASAFSWQWQMDSGQTAQACFRTSMGTRWLVASWKLGKWKFR